MGTVKAQTMRSWNLNASDLEESVKFYRDVLGAEVRQEHQVQGVNVVRLNLGDFGIGLFDASAGERPGVPHHTVGIDGPDDPEQLKSELESKGLVVEGIRVHGGGEGSGYSLYLNDPSGNRIELSRSVR